MSGPTLNGLIGAVSLYFAGVSLRSGRHAMMWAAALAAVSLQWAVRALDPFGGPHSPVMIVSNLLGLLSPILYAYGFRLRRDEPQVAGPFWMTAAASLLLVPILSLTADGRVVGVVVPLLRDIFWIFAFSRLSTSRLRITPAELAVAAMLAIIVLMNAIMSLVWLRDLALGLPAPAEIVTAGVTAGPPGAALGIFSLLLIASDYASQRRTIVYADPLTGIFNRLGLEAIARKLTWRRKRAMSIAIADIDHFKAVNDHYGHGAGDAVLKDLATCLASQLRPGEAAVRIGGEEFALILHDRREAALARIEAMRQSVAELRLPAFPAIAITASFGLAEHERGETVDVTMGRADAALYRSKRDGRDRCTMADTASP